MAPISRSVSTGTNRDLFGSLAGFDFRFTAWPLDLLEPLRAFLDEPSSSIEEHSAATIRFGAPSLPPHPALDRRRPFLRSDDPDLPWSAAGAGWWCRFNPDTRDFLLCYADERGPHNEIICLDSLFLPVIVGVGSSGGLAFHGASLTHEGKAYLFVGPSGSGKSTLARRMPLNARLSDERALIVPNGLSFDARHSAFPGTEGLPSGGKSAGLAAIFCLRHGDRTAATRVGHARAFGELKEQQFPVRFPWRRGNPLDPLLRLVQTTPVYDLCFTADADPRDIIDGLAL